MGKNEILSFENWRNAIAGAIEELPEDIKASVGFAHLGEKAMRLTVAGHAFADDDDESYVSRIEVRWWDSLREEGWPTEFDSLFGPGGTMEDRADWPVISISGESRSYDDGVHPGHSTLRDLKRAIQVALLDEMHGGGGGSLISKDEAGRFCRDDGALILDWQRDAS